MATSSSSYDVRAKPVVRNNSASPKRGDRRSFGSHCTADFCRSIAAECLSTFFFMIVVCMTDLQWDNAEEVDVLRLSLTLGFAVATLVHCFEHISGAHMNPAVTLALMIIRHTGFIKGLFYIGAQFLGAAAAVLLLKGFLPTSVLGNLGLTVVSPQITSHQAMGLEFLMGFLLVFTIMSSTEMTRFASKMVAMPIGLCFLMNTLWGYEFTGASMNPARSIGSALVLRKNDMWPVILEVYLAGPVGGGIVASLIYKFLFDPTFVSGSMRSLRSSANFESEEDNMITLQSVSSPHRKDERTSHRGL